MLLSRLCLQALGAAGAAVLPVCSCLDHSHLAQHTPPSRQGSAGTAWCDSKLALLPVRSCLDHSHLAQHTPLGLCRHRVV